MMAEINTEWPHQPSYTIFRKMPTPLSFVYDYVLIPPLIIKNALPCPVRLRIDEELLETKELLVGSKLKIESSCQTFVLDKEDEKEIYEIKNSLFSKSLLIELSIGENFAPTILKMKPVSSRDSTFPVKITDFKDRNFNLFCKVST